MEKKLDEQLRKLNAVEEERKLWEKWVNSPPIFPDGEKYLKLKGGDRK